MALDLATEVVDSVVKITLTGELDASVAEEFRQAVADAAEKNPAKLVLIMNDLTFMASAGLRVLIFAKQKMGEDVGVYVIGAKGPVLGTIEMSGFHHSVYLQESFDE